MEKEKNIMKKVIDHINRMIDRKSNIRKLSSGYINGISDKEYIFKIMVRDEVNAMLIKNLKCLMDIWPEVHLTIIQDRTLVFISIEINKEKT